MPFVPISGGGLRTNSLRGIISHRGPESDNVDADNDNNRDHGNCNVDSDEDNNDDLFSPDQPDDFEF